MPQLSYDYFLPVASAGLKVDLKFDYVISCRAYEVITVGLGVVKVFGEDYVVRLPSQNSSTIVLDADLVTSNQIDGEINGVAITPVVYAVSHLATMTAVAAAIEAADANVTATVGGANDRTIFVTSIAGSTATVSNFIVTLGASQAGVTEDNTTSDTLYGIALRQQTKENLWTPQVGSDGPAPYYEGDCVSTETQGLVWVVCEDGCTSDDPVYLRFVAGGASELIGQFRTDDDSGSAFLVPSTVARWMTSASAGELAQLQIQLP